MRMVCTPSSGKTKPTFQHTDTGDTLPNTYQLREGNWHRSNYINHGQSVVSNASRQTGVCETPSVLTGFSYDSNYSGAAATVSGTVT